MSADGQSAKCSEAASDGRATRPLRSPPKRWPGSGWHAGEKSNPRECRRKCRISEGKGQVRPHSDLHQLAPHGRSNATTETNSCGVDREDSNAGHIRRGVTAHSRSTTPGRRSPSSCRGDRCRKSGRDRERLGRLLLTLKARVQHGDFARRPRTGEHKHRADHDSTEIERMKADKRAHLLYPNLSVWTDNKFAICSRLRSPLQEIRNQPEANRLAFFRVKLCAYHVVMARRRDKCAAVIRGRQDVLIIAAS